MKPPLVAFMLVLVNAALLSPNVSAREQGSGGVILAAFEGTIEIFAENKPVRVKTGMDLSDNSIIRVVPGTALLYFPASSLYGVIKDGTSTPSACLKRPISDANLERIRTKSAGILEIFLESSSPQETPTPKETPTPLETMTPQEGSGAAFTVPDNINLVLILDASTSMRAVFPEMQRFVFSLIMEQQLKSGDFLSLFVFGAQTSKVYSATLDLPKDQDSLKAAIFGIKPAQLATDIGAMLAELQKFITSQKLPNDKTVIIWATDGKNNPLPSSPWAGRDIYQPEAFAAYKIVKSAEYKVLLLSIGDDVTAAESLSGPLGGEVLKVDAKINGDALGKLLADFSESIELIAPKSIGKTARLDPRIPLAFLSTYGTEKTISIERILVSVDGSARTALVPADRLVKIGPMDQRIVEYQIALPANLAKGGHVMEIELVTEGNRVIKTLQQVGFVYEPFNYALVFSATGAGVAVVVFLVASKRRKDRKAA